MTAGRRERLPVSIRALRSGSARATTVDPWCPVHCTPTAHGIDHAVYGAVISAPSRGASLVGTGRNGHAGSDAAHALPRGEQDSHAIGRMIDAVSIPARVRLVVDTNVLVASLLSPGRVPDRVLALVRQRGDVVLYDARIAREYREVLARPKFRALDATLATARIDALLSHGIDVAPCTPFTGAMTDDDDRAFVEVALTGGADAIVTGNTKHYPLDLGVVVMGPTALLSWLGGAPLAT